MQDLEPTILVVDDMEDNLDLLEFAMKRKPVRMLRATSGKDCLRIAKEKLPDIIVLDIQMPEMDGFETLRFLRAMPETATIPVIFLTAQKKDPKSIEHGLMMGASEYLMKPIDIDELLVRARTLIKLSRTERELERTKADFYAMLIHDLRSPLAGIKEVLALTREFETANAPLTEDHFAMLKASQESSERMLQLINDFLDVSKFEAGKMPIHKDVLPIVPLVERVAKQMEFQFRQKQVTLTLEPAPGLPDLPFDAIKIGQVMQNLLSNALKFTKPGGHVEVLMTVTSADNPVEGGPRRVLETRVRDNGVGIPAAELPTIFERYKQGVTGTRAAQKGTGLGLTICKMFVEAHGGTISAQSEVGISTTFRFALPID